MFSIAPALHSGRTLAICRELFVTEQSAQELLLHKTDASRIFAFLHKEMTEIEMLVFNQRKSSRKNIKMVRILSDRFPNLVHDFALSFGF